MKAFFIASVVALLFAVCIADDVQIRTPKKIPALACNLCQNIVGKVEQTAGRNVTSMWLKTTVTSICTTFNIVDFCTRNIFPKLNVILPWIQKKASPDKVCIATRLCKNTTKPSPPTEEIMIVEEEEKRDMEQKKNKTKNPFHGLGINCAVCENVIMGLEKVVSNNETVIKLGSDLVSVCTFLGINNWCNTNLKPKLAMLLPKLKAKTDPSALCKSLKYCSNSTRPPKPPSTRTPRAADMEFADDELIDDSNEEFEELIVKRESNMNIECGICQAVITYVKNAVGSNTAQAAIQKALNDACGKIPFAKTICQAIIAPFLQQIVDGIVNQQDPTAICLKIKLCK